MKTLKGSVSLVIAALSAMIQPSTAQTAHDPQPRPVVVDSNDKIIGYPAAYDFGVIYLDIGDGKTVIVQINKSRFVSDRRNLVTFYYRSSDCGGKKYMEALNLTNFGYLQRDTSTIIYANTDESETIIAGSFSKAGQCTRIRSPEKMFAAPSAKFDLDSLNIAFPVRTVIR